MLRAVEEAAEWTLAKIAAVSTLIEDTAEYARKAAPKQYSRELIGLIFVQPYCRIENVVESGIAKRQTASVYLHRPAEVGILQEEHQGLNKLFLNTRFSKLLTREANKYAGFAMREAPGLTGRRRRACRFRC
jgi:Fic family protein